jgi:alkaline phosphatase D
MTLEHLRQRSWSRRDFLGASRAVAAVFALGALPASGDEPEPRFPSNPFSHGIASGDPLPSGVVLWTRLDSRALDEAGASRARVPVRWEVSEDEHFRRIVRKGTELAVGDLGHSVHAEVEGLRPERHYWYRFMTGGQVSATGRTRTAPAEGASLDRVRFAFVSCQYYEAGYYTAYRRIAEEDLDLVVHLGDYIYEGGVGRDQPRHHDGPTAITLEQYRSRYALYKSDVDLQAAHAALPWIVTPDDHEVSNDYAGAIPENDMPVDQFLKRRADAYQAYYEFMPLRRTSMPAGPDMRLFRRLPFGRLAAFHVLDTRQYRSNQPCGNGRKPLCADALSESQRMMGQEQEQWLCDGLHRSPARWNIVANQVMMAPVAQDANGTATYSMDQWNGYVRERARVMDFLGHAKPSNPIVITGDIHTNWVADLKEDFDQPSSAVVGTELVGTSITSGGDGSDSTENGERALAENPHVKFFNSQRGYVRCTLTPEQLTADYQTLPYVREPGAPIHTRASFVVENGRPGAQKTTG